MKKHILACQASLGRFWEFCHPGSREREYTIITVTSLCIILSLFLSLPLWMRESRIFLPSPIVPPLLDLPIWTDKILLYGVIMSALTLMVEPRLKKLLIVFPAVFTVWVLQDSLRWQPFLYMYAFIFLALFFNARLKDGMPWNRLLPLQIMVIGIYFWAGIGKLNLYFYENIFPWFVHPFLGAGPFVSAAAHAVPIMELSIGICLAIPALRLFGLGLAAGMLAIVLLCLGPLGHNWGFIVWPWNVLLFTLACACFVDKKNSIFDFRELRRPLALLAAVLFLILPAGWKLGYWGAHPSFKLYSGDVAFGVVTLGDKEIVKDLPPVISNAVLDNQINLIDWTINEFSIAATPSLPGYSLYATGAQGLCRYLKEPDKAYLSIEMPELKSLKSREVLDIKPLCPAGH